MGVRGLHSFAQAYQAAISEVREFPAVSSAPPTDGQPAVAAAVTVTATTLAVDAWAWLYDAWLTHFGESVQGGNYKDLLDFVVDTVNAWRLANLEPVFFWDGPAPLAKLPTTLNRRASTAARNSAFMRSSATSRASRSFQAECYPRLPLAADTVKAALKSQGVQTVVTQAEADAIVAELAEETSGIALSKDSDFFIYCARGAGKARYAPLDSLEYLVDVIGPSGCDGLPAVQSVEPDGGADDDGFEQVASSRRRRKGPRAGATPTLRDTATVLNRPPPRASLGSQYTLRAVRLRAYSSHALASQLRIPPALLPLLASVIGNDYSSARQEEILFRHIQNRIERVQEAATIVHTEWQRSLGMLKEAPRPRGSQQSAGHPRKTLLKAALTASVDDDARSEYSVASSATATPLGNGRAPSLSELDTATIMDPVRALVVSTVNALLTRGDQVMHRTAFVDESDKEACVQSIIDSIATYSLLANEVQVLSSEGSAQDFFVEIATASCSRPAIEKYRSAFFDLAFSPDLVSVLAQRTFLLPLAPEDPDLKPVHVGATRSIRRWLYAILFGAYGMHWARETMEEPVKESPQHDTDDPRSEGSTNAKPKYRPGERPEDVISVDTESTESASFGSAIDDEQADVDSPVSRPSSALGNYAEVPDVVKPPPAVKEHLRKGDRLTGELVEICSLPSLLEEHSSTLPSSLAALSGQYIAAASVQSDGLARQGDLQVDPLPPPAPLLPLQTRIDLYRHALSAGDEAMDVIPFHLLPLAACVRHLIATIALESGESKRRLNWTRAEVISAVKAGCHTRRIHSTSDSTTTATVLPREHWAALPSNRGIHLASTLQLTLDASHDLACSLLLHPEVLPAPHTLFDGPLFQLLLEHDGNATQEMHMSREVKDEAGALVKSILSGYEEDLALAPAELKRLRKENKKRNKDAQASGSSESSRPQGGGGGVVGGSRGGNLFAMLQSQSADTGDRGRRPAAARRQCFHAARVGGSHSRPPTRGIPPPPPPACEMVPHRYSAAETLNADARWDFQAQKRLWALVAARNPHFRSEPEATTATLSCRRRSVDDSLQTT
ncbi:unnamed protein product [Parajaminaea phylloscopi]